MRKIIYTALVAFGLIACDNIAEEERLIYEPLPEVNRSVLIEDFTGQRCVNCPTAADEIQKLQKEYGKDAIIAVGIHGGPMAVYPNQWPMGMVNRGAVCAYTEWKTHVREELQKKAPVNILIDNDFPGEDGVTRVSATIQGVRGSTTGKLQIWIVEDNITAIQLMPDGKANQEYVHQHVFRATVNGEWGEDIKVEEGKKVTTFNNITIPSDWKRNNLSFVAFVYNEQGVQQVVRYPFNIYAKENN